MMRVQLKHTNIKQVLHVATTTTLGEFLVQVCEIIHQPSYLVGLAIGFPPKLVEGRDSDTITSLGIKNGTSVTVVIKDGEEVHVKQGKLDASHIAMLPQNTSGKMMTKAMPRDNSCLYHALAYLCADQDSQANTAQDIRSLIASIVMTDPSTYNSTLLNMPPIQYQTWVLDSNQWGGFIELLIISTLFRVEIVAMDILYLREDVFGEQHHWPRRIFLLYSGDHYDACVWVKPGSSVDSSEGVLRMFNTKDVYAWEQARGLARSLHTQAVRAGKCKEQNEWRRELRSSTKRSIEAKSNSTTYSGGHGKVKDLPATATARDSSKRVAPTTSEEAAEVKAHDGWACSMCTYVNTNDTNDCQMCGLPNPAATADDMPALVDEDEVAPPKPQTAPEVLIPQQPSLYDPRVLAQMNMMGMGGFPQQIAPAHAPVEWDCSACTFHNESTANKCVMCGNHRPTPPVSNSNHATHTTTFSNGYTSTTTSTSQSGGGFSAQQQTMFLNQAQNNTWTCPHCQASGQMYGLLKCSQCQQLNPYLNQQVQQCNVM